MKVLKETNLSLLETFDDLDSFFKCFDVAKIKEYDIGQLEAARDRYVDHLYSLVDDKLRERTRDFIQSFSTFKNLEDGIIRIFNHHAELGEELKKYVDLIDETDYKLWKVPRNCYLFHQMSQLRVDDDEDLKKSFYEFFLHELKNLTVSKKDLSVVIEKLPLCACDCSIVYFFHAHKNPIQELYNEISADSKKFKSKLDAFKVELCNALDFDQNLFEVLIELNCFLNSCQSNDASYKQFQNFTEDQKSELIKILKVNDQAKKILLQIVENNFIDQYDFKTLKKLLTKDDKKKKIKLNF